MRGRLGAAAAISHCLLKYLFLHLLSRLVGGFLRELLPERRDVVDSEGVAAQRPHRRRHQQRQRRQQRKERQRHQPRSSEVTCSLVEVTLVVTCDRFCVTSCDKHLWSLVTNLWSLVTIRRAHCIVSRFVGCMEEANVLEIGQLGDRVACEIIRAWLRKARRHLTNFQVVLQLQTRSFPSFLLVVFF